jgi:hypothetical protein
MFGDASPDREAQRQTKTHTESWRARELWVWARLESRDLCVDISLLVFCEQAVKWFNGESRCFLSLTIAIALCEIIVFLISLSLSITLRQRERECELANGVETFSVARAT